MKKSIILNYITNLTKDDLKILSENYQINLEEQELNIIYTYLKKYGPTIGEWEPHLVLKELKPKLRPLTYDKLKQLYLKYQNNKPNYFDNIL